jgi:hypothetical protein
MLMAGIGTSFGSILANAWIGRQPGAIFSKGRTTFDHGLPSLVCMTLFQFETMLTLWSIGERIQACEQLLDLVYKTATKAILDYMKKGLHHQDYHYGNLVFSDDLSQADLVDWGIWTPYSGPVIERDVSVRILWKIHSTSELMQLLLCFM